MERIKKMFALVIVMATMSLLGAYAEEPAGRRSQSRLRTTITR